MKCTVKLTTAEMAILDKALYRYVHNGCHHKTGEPMPPLLSHEISAASLLLVKTGAWAFMLTNADETAAPVHAIN